MMGRVPATASTKTPHSLQAIPLQGLEAVSQSYQ